jgi:hypothetical protein
MYKCCVFTKIKVDNDVVMDEVKKNYNLDPNLCSAYHYNCGVPLLSSLPLLNILFPRTCVPNKDLLSQYDLITSNNAKTLQVPIVKIE